MFVLIEVPDFFFPIILLFKKRFKSSCLQIVMTAKNIVTVSPMDYKTDWKDFRVMGSNLCITETSPCKEISVELF